MNYGAVVSVVGSHAVRMDKAQSVFLGKGMRIAHPNVRSLLGNKKSDLLRTQIGISGMDIFTISETWLTDYVPDKLVTVSNYSISSMTGNGTTILLLHRPKRGEDLRVMLVT